MTDQAGTDSMELHDSACQCTDLPSHLMLRNHPGSPNMLSLEDQYLQIEKNAIK